MVTQRSVTRARWDMLQGVAQPHHGRSRLVLLLWATLSPRDHLAGSC